MMPYDVRNVMLKSLRRCFLQSPKYGVMVLRRSQSVLRIVKRNSETSLNDYLHATAVMQAYLQPAWGELKSPDGRSSDTTNRGQINSRPRKFADVNK